MFAQRIGWLSLVAGAVFAVGLSLSSVAWAQKGGPPPKPAQGVSGIEIIVKAKPGGQTFKATTDNTGAFAFANLEPGTYEVVGLSTIKTTKSNTYSVNIETGWTVRVGSAEGDADGGTGKQRDPKTVKGSKSNADNLANPSGVAGVGDPASDNAGGGVGQDDPKSKNYNSIKSNTSSIAKDPGGGKDLPGEKYSTTKSNIKNVRVDVPPDGFGQLTDPVVMEIHEIGSEIMISGPGAGVVESLGANPGDPGYAIKEQGIKRVKPVVVAATMFLRGSVSVRKATTGLGDPATGVGTQVDDVPADVKPRKRGFKLPLPE